MGVFDRKDNDGEKLPPPPTDAPTASDKAEVPPPPPAAGGEKAWLDEEDDARAAQASKPVTAEETDSPSKGETKVVKEDSTPGGPPDMENYDPNADAYNKNKIPGAANREKYAQSLVPPGGDP